MTVLPSPDSLTPLETGFQLVARSQVVHVRDAEHAEQLLRRRQRWPGAEDALRSTARALARGEVLLLRTDIDRPLDPPNFEAVPLLSALAAGAPQ